MKRMETRLGSRKEDLSETSFFDGKIIKDCFPDSTIGQLLEYYDRAIRYNEHNLDVIENSVCTIFFHIVSTDDKLLQNVSSSNWYIWQIHLYRRNVSQRKHNANESITLCKQVYQKMYLCRSIC
ncbi:odorant receptor 13a-like [Vespula squamosa]|uniref:Odorant receptor 13a-like n=1 Tax=Vespula squamosa TaxID=30214 RepID=A0ABD2BAM2_VESSQ